jgi:CBS-domain-containing membrane protein
MRLKTKPLFSLTAQDLMSTAVLTIPRAMSLAGAAHLLAQAGISGAPVVDPEGRCVGVLSANDFVAYAEKGSLAAKRPNARSCAHSAWQVIDLEGVPEDEVEQFMTADPATAGPTTPLAELAQSMVDAHIHRLIVVDADDRPVGIVSSTDILAAVARSARRTLAGSK